MRGSPSWRLTARFFLCCDDELKRSGEYNVRNVEDATDPDGGMGCAARRRGGRGQRGRER